MSGLVVHEALEIDASWLQERYFRAAGPGGQHVNKVSTAVELRFAVEACPQLDEAVKARLRRLAGRRWNQQGEIVLRVDESRSQVRNRELARTRLARLIQAALKAPAKRRATRPTAASVRKRIDSKVKRGAIKTGRKPPKFFD